MRKIGLSLVLVGILGATSAVAEESGFFIGGQLGFGNTKTQIEFSSNMAAFTAEPREHTISKSYYGFIGGYKQFFTPAFGARYYAVAEFNYTKINANADALYNFLSNDALDFGAFAGLSLGYVDYSGIVSGFDMGINAGLRAVIAQKHSIELYSRFSTIEQEKTEELLGYDVPGLGYASSEMITKLKQPYQIGLRYTFSF